MGVVRDEWCERNGGEMSVVLCEMSGGGVRVVW